MTDSLSVALSQSRVLFERPALEREIRRMGAEVRAEYSGERPVYLTVMQGGLLFAAQLALEAGCDLEFDYLHASRYRGATQGNELKWLHRPATPLRGRRVLVADDILDEGHTLKAIVQWCLDEGAADVRVAVLAVKRHDRCVAGIHADYVGVEVPDFYVYGYGMDFKEQGRNLPGIYAWEP